MSNMESLEEHMEVLLQAHHIFEERSRVRGDHWAEYGIDEHMRQIEGKVGRLRMIAKMDRQPIDKDFDEALDIINYAAFVARLLLRQIGETNATEV